MIREIYSVLMSMAQPFLRARLKRRGVAEPGYLLAMDERFGYFSQPPASAPDAGGGGVTVWIHAVSLGETRLAALLIDRLRSQWPGMRLVLTHGTATGREEGAKLVQRGDVQVWQPWDTPGAVNRFLDNFRPDIGLLMETEVWPNLSNACHARGVPLVLVNARLSDKSFQQARRLIGLAGPAYRQLAAAYAQTQEDANRLAALGARVAGVFGNLKFDATPNANLLAQGRSWRARLQKPVIVFASSREGEEELFLQFLESNTSVVPVKWTSNAINNVAIDCANDVHWLIVPRHPQRFDEVCALVAHHGFKVVRRSQWADHPEQATPVATGLGSCPPTIWVGDSLGEMPLYYGLADVALLGGSFAPLGGQNLIEAAACACPVVMGPHTFNFAQAADMAAAAGAAIRVESLADGIMTALALAEDRLRWQAASQSGIAFALAHRGATDRVIDALVALLAARQTGANDGTG